MDDDTVTVPSLTDGPLACASQCLTHRHGTLLFHTVIISESFSGLTGPGLTAQGRSFFEVCPWGIADEGTGAWWSWGANERNLS